MKGYFVTGTDTGVGKTFVSCSLARAATALGLRVFGFKPIETGEGDDQDQLARAAGAWQQGELRSLYRFAQPAAPLVAARAEHRTVDINRIDDTFRRGFSQSDLSIVEGAGGWRVPVTETADISRLAQRLGLPVLIVARAGLGTINHSLLTIEAVERDDLPVAALILSELPSDDPSFTDSNADQIRRRWAGPVLVLRSGQGLEPLLS